MTRSAGRNSV